VSPFRDLLLRVGDFWHLPTVIAVGLMVSLVALFSIDPLDIAQGEGQLVEARITRLSSTDRSRYQGRWPGLRVSAETTDGIRGTTTALPPDLKGCEVGDRIEAQQVGMKLYPMPRPCE
jgi:hypothetical protein